MLNNHRYYRRNGLRKNKGYYPLQVGSIKRTIAYNQEELIYRFQSLLVKKDNLTDENYHQDTPFEPLKETSISGLKYHFLNKISDIQRQYGTEKSNLLVKKWTKAFSEIMDELDLRVIINKYLMMLDYLDKSGFNFLDSDVSGSFTTLFNNRRLVLVGTVDTVESDTNSSIDLARLDPNELLQLVCAANMTNRHKHRNPTPYEYLAIQVADEEIRVHGFTGACIVPWGNPGFRSIQTQASITDPGLGHITGTLSNMDYINGTNVHIEYLERGEEEDREKVEPYRIPDSSTIGEVKLLAGEDTTVTSYVGRPMFEDSFDNSFIKTLNTMSSVISSIFMEGLTECKVAMERMTATQMVTFMQSLAANAIRDKSLQVLSAAFAINVPIVDDRPETLKANNGRPIKVTNRMEVAKLGIELTHAGGFEKVTFDGTANTYPSVPIMEQLGYENALNLVHDAHTHGLLTYFSAGFRYKHLEDIVLSGTDGIGLGGAQILRFMDKRNGFQGPFKKDNVGDILEINSKAEKSIIGQGTQLLSRMDQMHYEHSLPTEYEPKRDSLFEALLKKDNKTVNELLFILDELVEIPNDTKHPVLESAERIIKYANRTGIFAELDNDKKESYKLYMEKAINDHDYSTLYDAVNIIENRRNYNE